MSDEFTQSTASEEESTVLGNSMHQHYNASKPMPRTIWVSLSIGPPIPTTPSKMKLQSRYFFHSFNGNWRGFRSLLDLKECGTSKNQITVHTTRCWTILLLAVSSLI